MAARCGAQRERPPRSSQTRRHEAAGAKPRRGFRAGALRAGAGRGVQEATQARLTAPLDPVGLFRRLHEAEVRYVIVGGFAVIAHGYQRTTSDLDICPDPDPSNLARFAFLLRDLEARHADVGDFDPDEFPYDPTDPEQLAQGGNFRLETSRGSLDIMQWIPGFGDALAYPQLIRDAITAEVRGVPVTVCSRADLATMKRAADRPQDRADIEQLELGRE